MKKFTTQNFHLLANIDKSNWNQRHLLTYNSMNNDAANGWSLYNSNPQVKSAFGQMFAFFNQRYAYLLENQGKAKAKQPFKKGQKVINKQDGLTYKTTGFLSTGTGNNLQWIVSIEGNGTQTTVLAQDLMAAPKAAKKEKKAAAPSKPPKFQVGAMMETQQGGEHRWGKIRNVEPRGTTYVYQIGDAETWIPQNMLKPHVNRNTRNIDEGVTLIRSFLKMVGVATPKQKVDNFIKKIQRTIAEGYGKSKKYGEVIDNIQNFLIMNNFGETLTIKMPADTISKLKDISENTALFLSTFYAKRAIAMEGKSGEKTRKSAEKFLKQVDANKPIWSKERYAHQLEELLIPIKMFVKGNTKSILFADIPLAGFSGLLSGVDEHNANYLAGVATFDVKKKYR